MQSHLHQLKELKAKVLVFAEVSGCIHGEADPGSICARASRRRAGRSMARSSPNLPATPSSVQIAYHHHMGTVIESAEDVDNLMTHPGEAVGLLLIPAI